LIPLGAQPSLMLMLLISELLLAVVLNS